MQTTILNIDVSPNTDGFSLAGGTTQRTFNVSGSNLTLLGSGSITATFPTSSTTLAGTTIFQQFTAQQNISASGGGTQLSIGGANSGETVDILGSFGVETSPGVDVLEVRGTHVRVTGSVVLNNVSASGVPTYDHYQHTGAYPYKSFYIAGGHTDGTALGTAQLVKGTLYAIPFLTQRGGTVDEIVVNVVTARASTTGTLAIYENSASNFLYPTIPIMSSSTFQMNTVIARSGSKTNNTMWVRAGYNNYLNPGQLYWVALYTTASVQISSSVVSGLTISSSLSILGTSNFATSSNLGISLATASTWVSGAAPDPFTAGARPYISEPHPAIGLYFTS